MQGKACALGPAGVAVGWLCWPQRCCEVKFVAAWEVLCGNRLAAGK